MPNTKLKEAITKLRIIIEAAEYYNDESDRKAIAFAIRILERLEDRSMFPILLNAISEHPFHKNNRSIDAADVDDIAQAIIKELVED